MFSHYISYLVPFLVQVLHNVYVIRLRLELVVVDSPIDWGESSCGIVYFIRIHVVDGKSMLVTYMVCIFQLWLKSNSTSLTNFQNGLLVR